MTFRGEERMRHLERDRLEGFLRGELPRAEAQAVVRHLLTGCASCRRITGRLWRLGDEPLSMEGLMEGGNPLRSEIEVDQAQLREIVRDLEAIKFRLLGVKANLLSSPGTGRLPEEEPPDPGSEIRTVIECVLHDSLEPAIRNLRGAAVSAVSEP
jgi:hypothetical protein